MENYNSNYLNNSFGHNGQQSKSQYEMFGYDGMSTAMSTHNQVENQWNNHDNQTSYLMSNFSNYFETQSPTPISNIMTMNATTNSTQQYSLSTESMDFIANTNGNIVQEMLPLIENIDSSSTAPTMDEKVATQFPCQECDCSKTYTTVSGLNNHMKKKHSGPARYHCDECAETFSTTQQRTLHKIKEHNGRKYQASRYKSSIIKEPTNTQKSGKISDDHLHKCQSCDDSFNHKADLVRHMRNRRTQNRFRFTLCYRDESHSLNINVHTLHKNRGIRVTSLQRDANSTAPSRRNVM